MPSRTAATSSPRRWAAAAGWLAYGAAIAGEASLVISVEDITGKYEAARKSPIRRPARPPSARSWTLTKWSSGSWPRCSSAKRPKEGVRRDRHRRRTRRVPAGRRTSRASPATNTATSRIAQVNLAACSPTGGPRYTAQTGKSRMVTGLQLGYECRCPPPGLRRHAGQPTRRGCRSAWWKTVRRRDGLGNRTVEPRRRALQSVGRSATLATARAATSQPDSGFPSAWSVLETYVHE